MTAYQIREGWAVVVPDGHGDQTTLGVFFDEEAVEPWRRRGDCAVLEVPALTIGGETFVLGSRQPFVADAGVSLAEAAAARLSHTQRRLLGLPHDPEIAAQEPRSALSLTDEARERERVLALVLTEEEAKALGLYEEQQAFWDKVMEQERLRMDRRREEIEGHPLIGRVFRAESNSRYANPKQTLRTHQYVVTGFDEGSGKYRCRAHGRYACLTPGAWDEKLLYSAEEIEAGVLSKYDDTDGLEYDADGHPYVPHEREVHARIVDHREETA